MSGNRTKADATAELVKLGLRPRLLDADLAAAYLGLSTGAFLKGVSEGAYPEPIESGKRRLWDVRALDAAIDRKSALATGSDPIADPIMGAIDAA